MSWSDDGESPKLSKSGWGNIDVYLAAGSQNTQFKLQKLASNVKPKKHIGVYKIDKSIGPNGDYYFIRLEGSKKQSNGYPVMSFSARFELKNMTGTFNSTVMAAAKGAEGAAPSSSSSSSSTSGSSGTGSSVSSSVDASSASSPAASSASLASKTSGAGRLEGGAAALVATLVMAAASFFTLM